MRIFKFPKTKTGGVRLLRNYLGMQWIFSDYLAITWYTYEYT